MVAYVVEPLPWQTRSADGQLELVGDVSAIKWRPYGRRKDVPGVMPAPRGPQAVLELSPSLFAQGRIDDPSRSQRPA